jgi:hypothetical protein
MPRHDFAVKIWQPKVDFFHGTPIAGLGASFVWHGIFGSLRRVELEAGAELSLRPLCLPIMSSECSADGDRRAK